MHGGDNALPRLEVLETTYQHVMILPHIRHQPKYTTGIILAILIILIAHPPTVRAQSVVDSSIGSVLARAYSMLKVHSPEAGVWFERALRMEPSNVLVRKQLGYLYLSDKNYGGALAQFRVADSLQPSDSTKLQMGYILMTLNRTAEAKGLFTRLQSSSSSYVSEQATGQLDMLSASATQSLWWTHVYASPYYDSRWESTFLNLSVTQGYDWSDDRKWSVYGIAALSADTRSSTGMVPQIISDNSLLFGVGLRAKLFYGFSLSAQEGVAFDLVGRRDVAFARNDFRLVATYGNGIYAPFAIHPDVQTPFYPFADFYTSLGYYSRYKNTIGYLQGRVGVRMVEVGHTAADVYLLGGWVKDTEKEYYSNTLEGGGGFRLIPHVAWGLYIMGEYRRGQYLDVGGVPSPYGSTYNSFRLFFIFDRTF